MEFDGNREHLNSFLQDCHVYLALITRDPLTFGSYNKFLENVHKAFAATDIEGDNFVKEMEPLTIISHNSEFCLEEPKSQTIPH